MEFTEGKSSDELMRAQTVLWTHIFNHIDSMSLKCAVELGIPDAIHSYGKPITLSHLLSALSLSPAKAPHLQRLMRMLTHSGIFARNNHGGDDNEEDAYSLTPVSSLLVKSNDSSTGLSGLVVAMLHPVIMNPFQCMSAWLKSEEPTPFSVEHGGGLWEVTGRNPEFNRVFNEGMASDAKFLMDVLLRDCGDVFQGIESLVDVGGGTGSAATVISEAFPNVKCSVLELPHVVSTIREKGDVDFIAGDMFDFIPPADAVLLKWILHDWSDEDCVKILRRCREAISCGKEGGKVIIIDMVMGSDSSSPKSDTAQLYMDTLMMVVCGGAERGEQQWRKLFIDAGFTRCKITPALGLRSVIEVYP